MGIKEQEEIIGRIKSGFELKAKGMGDVNAGRNMAIQTIGANTTDIMSLSTDDVNAVGTELARDGSFNTINHSNSQEISAAFRDAARPMSDFAAPGATREQKIQGKANALGSHTIRDLNGNPTVGGSNAPNIQAITNNVREAVNEAPDVAFPAVAPEAKSVAPAVQQPQPTATPAPTTPTPAPVAQAPAAAATSAPTTSLSAQAPVDRGAIKLVAPATQATPAPAHAPVIGAGVASPAPVSQAPATPAPSAPAATTNKPPVIGLGVNSQAPVSQAPAAPTPAHAPVIGAGVASPAPVSQAPATPAPAHAPVIGNVAPSQASVDRDAIKPAAPAAPTPAHAPVIGLGAESSSVGREAIKPAAPSASTAHPKVIGAGVEQQSSLQSHTTPSQENSGPAPKRFGLDNNPSQNPHSNGIRHVSPQESQGQSRSEPIKLGANVPQNRDPHAIAAQLKSGQLASVEHSHADGASVSPPSAGGPSQSVSRTV